MSVMPSNYLILCRPLLQLPSIFPNIRVFSNKSALRIRWRKYWSFSFNISPSNKHPGLISFRMDWFKAPNMILHILTLLFHNIHLMFNQYTPSSFRIFFPFIKFMEITLHLLSKSNLNLIFHKCVFHVLIIKNMRKWDLLGNSSTLL